MMAIPGLWAIAVLGLFVWAIRLSYAVEKSSDGGRTRGLPRFANMPRVVFNVGIATDAETQALRRRMILLLVVVALLFVGFGVFVSAFLPEPASAFPENA